MARIVAGDFSPQLSLKPAHSLSLKLTYYPQSYTVRDFGVLLCFVLIQGKGNDLLNVFFFFFLLIMIFLIKKKCKTTSFQEF